MPPRERKRAEVDELGCHSLFKSQHREDWTNVWRHLVEFLIPLVEPLNMGTEADDLWVKVIHTEMEFDYTIPAPTWRFCFALHCNAHNVTFPFRQLSTSFLVARFWNYQILPCVQPYTSEHKGPDVHRTEESLGFHANHSTSIICSSFQGYGCHAVCGWLLLHPALQVMEDSQVEDTHVEGAHMHPV